MNYQKKAGETRTYLVDFSGKLERSTTLYDRPASFFPLEDSAIEILSGTPTVTEIATADLTISNVGINTESRAFPALVYPASHAVEFTVSGGTTRTDYTLRVTVATDASPQQTLIEDIRLQVL